MSGRPALARLTPLPGRLIAGGRLLALAACTQPSTPAAPVPGPLVLGTLIPRTGDLAHLGPAEDAGVQLAVKDIDAGGGVLGLPVTLVDGDSGDAFSSVASQTVDRLIGRKVTAVVGATGSAVTLTVVDKVVGAGIAEVSPGDASAQLAGYPDRGLYFRIVPPDTFEAAALASTIFAAGHRTLSVLAVRDPSAAGYAAALAADFRKAGGRVLSSVEYDGQATDLSGPAGQMAVSGGSADVVIGMGETSGIVLDLVKANAGPDVVPLYVTDLAPWATLAQGLTAAQSAGITGIRPGAAADPAFLARLAAQAPDLKDVGYAAQSYDATVLIALAADVARSVRGHDIAAALPGVTTGRSVCTAYAQCLALVKAGRTIAYAGQAGAVRLDSQGEPMDGTVGVYRFGVDGKVSPVGTYRSGTFRRAG